LRRSSCWLSCAEHWSTVGVSPNIIDASFQALMDSIVYQLVNPGGLAGWSDAWIWVQHTIGLSPPSWLSASLLSFVCAGVAAIAFARVEHRARR